MYNEVLFKPKVEVKRKYFTTNKISRKEHAFQIVFLLNLCVLYAQPNRIETLLFLNNYINDARLGLHRNRLIEFATTDIRVIER